MKLLVINGSPKKKESNTGVLITHFISGIKSQTTLNEKSEKTPYTAIETLSLSKSTPDVTLEAIAEADHIVIAFPLYGYAMPAQLHELLIDLYEGNLDEPTKYKLNTKSIGFIIQYGFKEAVHARPIEKFIESYVKRVGAGYIGTVIKGGCDNLYKEKDRDTAKTTIEGIRAIGADFTTNHIFSPALLKDYSAPETQEKTNRLKMKVFVWLANKFYWEKQMRENGVTKADSFRKPYAS